MWHLCRELRKFETKRISGDLMNTKKALNYMKQFIYTGLIVGGILIYSGIEFVVICYILVGYITTYKAEYNVWLDLNRVLNILEFALYANLIPFVISLLMRIWNKTASEIMILITILMTGILFIVDNIWTVRGYF